jgi:glycosyltransferase involved in cell wall biosynthesis
MRVLMFGMYDSRYPRARITRAAMRRVGIELRTCHTPWWENSRDKHGDYIGAWNRVRLVSTILGKQASLLARGLRDIRGCDLIWVGFPGHADVPTAKLLSRITGVPVVFDAFISWHDTVIGDRELWPDGSFTSNWLARFDYWACRLSGAVVLDTPEHAAFFEHRFRVNPAKLAVLPVGADPDVFAPTGQAQAREALGQAAPCPDTMTVLQYAEYTPLHGGHTVLDAAALLGQRAAGGDPTAAAVRIKLIGDSGPQYASMRQRVADQQLDNVQLLGRVPEEALVRHIAAADLCLGIFGDTAKAQRVVPNKVYQGLAMARPVLTADTPAVRRAFRDGHELWLTPPDDAESLTDAILRLASEPATRQRLAAQGRAAYERGYSLGALGDRVRAICDDTLARARGEKPGRPVRVRGGLKRADL